MIGYGPRKFTVSSRVAVQSAPDEGNQIGHQEADGEYPDLPFFRRQPKPLVGQRSAFSMQILVGF